MNEIRVFRNISVKIPRLYYFVLSDRKCGNRDVRQSKMCIEH